jgi:hypothetical protein
MILVLVLLSPAILVLLPPTIPILLPPMMLVLALVLLPSTYSCWYS